MHALHFSINYRQWDPVSRQWEPNTSLDRQREFMDKFYLRCSHSYERPSMVDRGIQVNKKNHFYTNIYVDNSQLYDLGERESH